jgi:hypothetical protein
MLTTEIRTFAECKPLCRVLFLGHSAKKPLPRAALDKVLLSVTSSFTESITLGTETHSTKTYLSRGKHSTKVALDKRPSKADRRQPLSDRGPAFDKEASLPSAKYLALGKAYFYFFNFGNQTFCGMFLHYVDLHVPFWHNYKSVSYNYWI